VKYAPVAGFQARDAGITAGGPIAPRGSSCGQRGGVRRNASKWSPHGAQSVTVLEWFDHPEPGRTSTSTGGMSTVAEPHRVQMRGLLMK
jgi:hypothetical protein